MAEKSTKVNRKGNKRILLLKLPYSLRNDYLGDYANIPTRQAYLAAILEKNNIDYDILDLNIESIKRFGIKNHNSHIDSLQNGKGDASYSISSIEEIQKNKYLKWLQKMIDDRSNNFDFIGMNGDNTWMCLTIARMVKRKDKNMTCIVGGRVATDQTHLFLIDGLFDFICRGYADKTLPLIIKNKISENTKGIAIKRFDKTIINQPITSIDEILTPDYSKIDLDSYFKIFNYVGIISSFSCPNKCPFCPYNGPNEQITRNHEKTIKEIRHFKDKYGINNFVFLDSCVNGKKGHIETLSKKIIDNDLNINWQGMFEMKGLTEKNVKTITDSGCMFATFGIETPVKKLQKIIKKDIDINKSGLIIESFNKGGTITRISFLYDLPEETLSDLFQSIRFAKKNHVKLYDFNKLRLYPGTTMYNDSESFFKNIIRKDGIIERIRKPAEIVELILKIGVAKASNRKNSWKFLKNRKILDFTYKKDYHKRFQN